MQWNDHDGAPEKGTKLCTLDELPEDEGRELVVGEGESKWPFRMFIVRRGDDVFGYVNSCPHQHIPLNYFPDRFVSADKQHIMCANHAALFNFENGHCVLGPCAGQSLQQIPLTLRNGEVVVG